MCEHHPRSSGRALHPPTGNGRHSTLDILPLIHADDFSTVIPVHAHMYSSHYDFLHVWDNRRLSIATKPKADLVSLDKYTSNAPQSGNEVSVQYTHCVTKKVDDAKLLKYSVLTSFGMLCIRLGRFGLRTGISR